MDAPRNKCLMVASGQICCPVVFPETPISGSDITPQSDYNCEHALQVFLNYTLKLLKPVTPYSDRTLIKFTRLCPI